MVDLKQNRNRTNTSRSATPLNNIQKRKKRPLPWISDFNIRKNMPIVRCTKCIVVYLRYFIEFFCPRVWPFCYMLSLFSRIPYVSSLWFARSVLLLGVICPGNVGNLIQIFLSGGRRASGWLGFYGYGYMRYMRIMDGVGREGYLWAYGGVHS